MGRPVRRPDPRRQSVPVILTETPLPGAFVIEPEPLEDDTEVFYQISEFYSSAHARGVRWNDPAFGIRWPDDDRTIADRDRSYPDFRRALAADPWPPVTGAHASEFRVGRER